MGEERTGWKKWGVKGVMTGLKISDYVGARANAVGAKFGTERFWPVTGDFQAELEKCERILRAFTVEGLPTEESTADGKSKRKVFRKIPPAVIREAKGIVIFTAMRTGIAPLSGAGGGGVVIVRMPNGEWSPPSFVSPNNIGAGAVIGLDVYNSILILRTDKAVQGFRTHHVTLGAEMGVAVGPLGYGVSAESGVVNRTPIYSYVVSKGFYAGVGIVGQGFIDRFDEAERVYQWPGIKAGDIFDGKVRRPYESQALYKALSDAELGVAQGASLEWDTREVTDLDLQAGETLRLPPTPEQLFAYESAGIQDEDDVKREQEERKAVRALPPPPRHPHSRNSARRTEDRKAMSGKRAIYSPDPGLSASECSSPELANGDQFTNADTSMSPVMRQYHTRDQQEAAETPLPESSSRPLSEIEARADGGVPIPAPQGSSSVNTAAPLPANLPQEATPVTPVEQEQLEIPKLNHLDSTGTASVYDESSEADPAPPVYSTLHEQAANLQIDEKR